MPVPAQGPSKTEQMRVWGLLYPWDQPLAGWAGLWGAHLLWGGWGASGAAAVSPWDRHSLPATAGPEVGQPGEQSPGCPPPPWGLVTAAADAWRQWVGAEEGSILPSPQSPGATPGLPWVGGSMDMAAHPLPWPRDPVTHLKLSLGLPCSRSESLISSHLQPRM